MSDPSAGPPIHFPAPTPGGARPNPSAGATSYTGPATTGPATRGEPDPATPSLATPSLATPSPATLQPVAPGSTPPPATPVPTPGVDSRGRVKRTRVSGVWVGLIAAAVFVILLIIFIAQNLTKVTVHFLGFNGRMSIGLIMLISAVCGLVIAAVPGSIRILQLRRDLKKNAAARSAV